MQIYDTIALLLVLSAPVLVLAGGKKGGKKGGDNHLPPMAHTVWWVIYNQPDKCITSPNTDVKCGLPDVFGLAFLESIASAGGPDPSLIAPNPEAEIGVIYGSGGISDAYGNLNVVMSLWKTADPLSSDGVVDPLGLAKGWTNTNAEIHIDVRSHGEAIFEDNAYLQQITYILDDYCIDPLLLWEGDKYEGNVCTGIQAAASLPGDSGDAIPLSWISSGEDVSGGHVSFTRRGDDNLQAVIETNIAY